MTSSRIVRKNEGEGAAVARAAVEVDTSAVGFGDGFDEAQADPRALRFAAQFVAGTVEALENFRSLGGGNAGAVIANGKTAVVLVGG